MSQDAVGALITKHYPGLLQLLRRKLRDPHLAEDILNQALVTSLEHVREGRLSEPSLIAGYVFQVAMNHSRNYRRKLSERSERRTDTSVIDELSDTATPEKEQSIRGLTESVRGIIQELPTPRDREIVKRFYLDEDEKEIICRDLGLSPLHFDKVIFRARQRMRALLEARGLRKDDLLDLLGLLLVCIA